MSELVAVGFDGPNEADRVLLELQRMQKEYLIDLEDAVVVIRPPEGKPRLKQSVNLAAGGAASGAVTGSLFGTLIGLLMLNPLAGFAIGGLVGAGAGALSGSLVDYGIDDDFIRSLGETLPPDSSALFVLVRKVQPEKVLAEIEKFNGRVLRTSHSREQEKRLEAALGEAGASPGA